jgi:hypothetical protein
MDAAKTITNSHQPIFPSPSIFDGDDAPPEYVIPSFIMCGGITLLTATRKHGKSTLVSVLCRHVADGTSFLGFPAMPKRPVIYFDYENPKAIVRARFNRLNIRDGNGFNYIWKQRDIPLPWNPHILAAVAQMHPRPLIAVDSFIRTFTGTNENDNVQIRAYFAQYNPLTEVGCPVLIQDHTDRNNQQTSRGAGDKECAVDFGFKLTNAGGGTGLTELTLEPFVIREGTFETLHFHYENGTFIPSDKTHAIESILMRLLVTEMNTSAIEEHSALQGYSRSDIRNIRDKLVTEGKLQCKPGKNNARLYCVAGVRDSIQALAQQWEMQQIRSAVV